MASVSSTVGLSGPRGRGRVCRRWKIISSRCETSEAPTAASAAKCSSPSGEKGEAVWGSHSSQSQRERPAGSVRQATTSSAGECIHTSWVITARATGSISARSPLIPKAPSWRRLTTIGTSSIMAYWARRAAMVDRHWGSPFLASLSFSIRATGRSVPRPIRICINSGCSGRRDQSSGPPISAWRTIASMGGYCCLRTSRSLANTCSICFWVSLIETSKASSCSLRARLRRHLPSTHIPPIIMGLMHTNMIE